MAITIVEIDEEEYKALVAFKKLILSGELKFQYDIEGIPVSYTKTESIENIDAVISLISK